MRWLELAPGFACNARCLGCHACSALPGDQMQPADVLRWLQRGRGQGARHLWLGGGEPTLRRDFLGTLRAARQLGYQRIKVQTNGMLFAYPGFADKAVAAGMTECNLLLTSLDPGAHDAMHQTPGAHALLEKAVAALRALPVRLEGDIRVTTRNLHEIATIVGHFGTRGFAHFNLWLFSAADEGPEALRDLVPRLTDCAPALVQARAAARTAGVSLCSLHTPPCALPPEAWDLLFDAAGLQLTVVNPDGRAFALETSVFEQGVYPEACTTCAARPWCRGIRRDYMAIHGGGEARALGPDAVAGRDLRGSRLELG